MSDQDLVKTIEHLAGLLSISNENRDMFCRMWRQQRDQVARLRDRERELEGLLIENGIEVPHD